MNERSGLTLGTPTPRGRRSRLAGAVAAVLASGAVALAVAPQATAGPVLPASGAGSADYPVAVEIQSVDRPSLAENGGSLTIKGTVRNTGRSTLRSAHAGVSQAAPRLDTRSAVARIAGLGNPSTAEGVDLPTNHFDLGDLAPGESKGFTLPVSPADLRLKQTGTYELAVDVWDGSDTHALGIGRTFLPYTTADGISRTTRLAVLWPITHAPELVAQTMPDNDQTSVLRDDSLAKDLAPGGRLYELVNTGSQLQGLTWVVDPDLLDTVYAMTKPYRVQKPKTAGESAKDDNTVPGTGTGAATAWLDKLRKAVGGTGDQVVSLPYADPDLASMAHNGSDQAALTTALRKAATAGQVTAEGRLSIDVRSDVAWPYQGLLDQRTAAAAKAAGSGLLLVNGALLPDSDELHYTPNAARTLSDGQSAAVADPTLSELFQGDLNTPHTASDAEQRFLGETLTINQEQPTLQRDLLLMPPRTMTAATAKVLADSVTAAHQGGWLETANLTEVATAKPTSHAGTAVPADYPKEQAASEISTAELDKTMGVQSGLDRLMQILTQPQRVRGPFSAAMVRSMSTEWRDQAKAGDAYRKGVGDYLAGLTAAVKVPSKTVVTLPGDNATLLVSVKNDLNQPVGNLQLRVTSGQLNRLRVASQQPVALDATTSKTFRFAAQAQAPGSVTMTAQLWTTGPDPQAYGDAVTFEVDVTNVTNGVVYVILGGVVLIALAGLRFSLQRKKRAAGGTAADADPDAPIQDAAAEPAVDAPDRVAGDEKVDH